MIKKEESGIKNRSIFQLWDSCCEPTDCDTCTVWQKGHDGVFFNRHVRFISQVQLCF